MAIQARNGCEQSFIELSDALKTRLYRTTLGILQEETLALEAVSETVYRAYKNIKTLREPKYIVTWFTRIAINTANTMYKQRKREQVSHIVIQETISISDDYSHIHFNDLITSLSLELKEVVSLKYFSDFTTADIAQILNIPEGTVKSRLNRALKQLRLEVMNE